MSFDSFNEEEIGGREVIGNEPLNFHLRITAPFVDLLNELPEFRNFSTGELFNLLPKKYHKLVPPIGEDLQIREAAYQREERMARAVIVGMLAKGEQIERYQAQRFLERLR